MKIALVELFFHNQSLNSLCKIFATSNHDITVVTSQKIYDDIYTEEFNSFDWLINKQGRAKSFFLRNLEKIDAHDIVFILTASLEDKVPYYKLKNAKTVLRIHNGNTWLNRRANIKFGNTLAVLKKDLFYLFRYFFYRPGISYFGKVLKNIDYVTFTTQKMTQFCLDNQLMDKEKVLEPLALAVHESKFYKHGGELCITVPGGIDKKRRDYKLLLQAVQTIKTPLKQNTTICFLGKANNPYARQIVEEFSKINNPNLKFVFFETRVPQKDYDEVMRKTDFLLTTIRIETKYKIYYEEYGFTKYAGMESDIIRNGKPAILPAKYAINEKLKNVCLFFNNADELQQILIRVINKEIPNTFYKRMDSIFNDFNAEKMMVNTNNIINKIMD